MSQLPKSVDRMPLGMRKPSAGPLLDPDEAIALALNGIPYEWWRRLPLSENSDAVKAIRDGLRMAGYKIEPI